MAQTTIRIPTPLRGFTDGADEVTAEGQTLDEVLHDLATHYDGLVPRILDDQGQIRSFVNLYLGADNVEGLEGLATPVHEGDVISVIPAVAGGRV